MTSHDLERLFESSGIRHGRALLLREADALALIDKAQHHLIAILGVDQCRVPGIREYAPLDRKPLGFNVDRAESWRLARQFVTDLAKRGLFFEVALETPRSTLVQRFRDHGVPARAWSVVFQAFFLAYLALLMTLIVGLS